MQKAQKLFFHNWKLQKISCAAEKTQNLEKSVFFKNMSPVCRVVPKTLRSPLYSQNFWFLQKLKAGFDKNKLEKCRLVPKKRRLKSRNAISNLPNIR